MRHARFLPLALAALAACADAVTAPDPSPGPIGPVGERSGGAGVSDPLTVAWNDGGLMYAQNLPLPDVGGGRVVWQDASSGSAAVLAYDLKSGTRTEEGAVSGTFAWPVTAGRWTVWSDGGGAIYLRDEAAGTVRAIGTGAGYTAQVDDRGEVAYVDYSAGWGTSPCTTRERARRGW